jgi:hypothetical protein
LALIIQFPVAFWIAVGRVQNWALEKCVAVGHALVVSFWNAYFSTHAGLKDGPPYSETTPSIVIPVCCVEDGESVSAEPGLYALCAADLWSRGNAVRLQRWALYIRLYVLS